MRPINLVALASLLVLACAGRTKPADARDAEAGERGLQRPAAAFDDDSVKTLFYEVADAPRIRLCAPSTASWVIITYAPEVLDEHRVRTREIHCREPEISQKCQLVAELRYYLDDPHEYFSVGAGIKPKLALRLAALVREWADSRRLLTVSADHGVFLISVGDCGQETQFAARLTGPKNDQRLEIIETRYSVEL